MSQRRLGMQTGVAGSFGADATLAAPPQVAQPARSASPNRMRGKLALSVILGFLVLICLSGFSYYVLPIAERVRSPLHDWFKPSGYVGQSAGWIAMALFLFLWLHPLRKKFRWLAFLGTLSRWLDVHIVIGLTMPLLVAIHAGWRFTGMIGWTYWSMLLICLSGIVGKYLYGHIPHKKNGLESTLEEVDAERGRLILRISSITGLDTELVATGLAAGRSPRPGRGLAGSILEMLSSDLARWRAARVLRRRWRRQAGGPVDKATLARAMQLARRQMALSQQVRMLEATHRLFRFWHIAHRPLAITALAAVLLHVTVVVVVGATWIR